MPPFCEKHQVFYVIRRDREPGESCTICPKCSEGTLARRLPHDSNKESK